MKRTIRRILALSLVLCLFLAASALGEAARFGPQDLNVNAAYAGASETDVRQAFGEPVSAETSTQAATGDTLTTWRYDGLTLRFTEGRLTGADWTSPAPNGPRGLKVGDSLDTVTGAFYRDAAASEDVLYTAGWVDALQAQLPPYGIVIRHADGSVTVQYLAPVEPYAADVAASPAEYVYQSHAILTFSVSSDTSTVVEINWSLGALAE
ncbi:MAG: hypothetical protein GX418_01745 [Clostridiales bacterium]|nr:hypothetical protein [Clostridiales bacterium]